MRNEYFVLLLGVLIAVGGLAAGCGGAEGQISIVRTEALALNMVRLDCLDEDGQAIEIAVFYPPDRVFVNVAQPDSAPRLLKYEPVYKIAGDNIPNSVLRSEVASGLLRKVQRAKTEMGGRKYFYAKCGDVIFRYTPDGRDESVMEKIAELVRTPGAELCSSYIARAAVDQLINGQWTQLTRFRFAGEMGFWLAPQDTIQMRFHFAAFKVRYCGDRVLIDGEDASIGGDHKFQIGKPQGDGFWPYDEPCEFFKTFSQAIVGPGEEFLVKYPVRPRSIQYSFDVFVLEGTELHALRQILDFIGPGMTQPMGQDIISDWPLIPTDVGRSHGSIDLGYPGGSVVPRWAVDKLIELGRGFGGSNEANRKVHDAYFRQKWAERKDGG